MGSGYNATASIRPIDVFWMESIDAALIAEYTDNRLASDVALKPLHVQSHIYVEQGRKADGNSGNAWESF